MCDLANAPGSRYFLIFYSFVPEPSITERVLDVHTRLMMAYVLDTCLCGVACIIRPMSPSAMTRIILSLMNVGVSCGI